jgi:hypothetical protein
MNDDLTQRPKRRLLDGRLRQVLSSSSVLVFSGDRKRVHLFEKSA